MMPFRYAILGDVHANWAALRAVLEDAEAQGVNRYACVGDVVGYNADPVPCLRKVRELVGGRIVRGNHDHYIGAGGDLTGFHPLAAEVVKWTRAQLSDEDRAWLAGLPYSKPVETFMMVHGTLDGPEMWGYVFDPLEADSSFAYQMSSVCFCGHTHVPVAFEKAGTVRGGLYSKLKIFPGRKYFINVGSVGQPRDGDPRAAYAIYDMRDDTVELRRVEYDIAETQAHNRAAGLPERASTRLAAGR